MAPASFAVHIVDKAPSAKKKSPAAGQTWVGPHAPDRLPLGTVRVGATVEASLVVYDRADDPNKVPLRVSAPPFVKVLDQTVIDRDFYDGDDRVKGVGGIVVIGIDTSKPGVFQGQVEVKLGTVTAKVPVAVVVKPLEPAAVKLLVVESPFTAFSTSDASVFKDWTDLATEWNVSYLTVARGKTLFRDLDLSNFDVVLLGAGELTEGAVEEIKRVRAFVEGGGRLVVAANRFYSGSVKSANKILEGYGLKMLNEEAPFGQSEAILDWKAFGPEVIRAGIRSARFYRASPVVITDAKRAQVLVRSAGVGGSEDGFVATATAGRGEVVVLGQSLWWSWMSAEQAKGTANAHLLRLLLSPAAEKLRKESDKGTG